MNVHPIHAQGEFVLTKSIPTTAPVQLSTLEWIVALVLTSVHPSPAYMVVSALTRLQIMSVNVVQAMKGKSVKKILTFVANQKFAVIFIHALIKAVMLFAHARQVSQVTDQ